MINNISFKANYIKPAYIKKVATDGTLKDHKVAFIELDSLAKKDCDAVQNLNGHWNKCSTFVSEIWNHMSDCNWNECAGGKRFFAITQQSSNFKDLDFKKILGIAQVNEGKEAKLSYLQVDPKTNKHAENRPYKRIGKAMLKSLKDVFKEKRIFVDEFVEGTEDFYKSNGYL